jgi:hypothetical protein
MGNRKAFGSGISLALALLAGRAMAESVAPSCEKYWTEARTLNDRYEEKHDFKAAQALWKLLPTGGARAPEGCEKRAETLSALARDAAYREKRLAAGGSEAFALAFRLGSVADGEFAESLDIALGKTIVRHPRDFLGALRAEHGDAYCADGLVGNVGTYVDDAKGRKRELGARLRALSRVQDPGSRKVRDICVGRLKKLQAE